MKALILAAGFGTRLNKDIKEDDSGDYNHLIGVPKPLVPISEAYPHLIDYWVKMIESCEEIDQIYVVTNGWNYHHFKTWAENKGFPLENIVNDGSSSNESRLGAIADIALVVEKKKIKDDLLVVGGDTLFYPSFSLAEVIADFYDKKGSTIVCYPVKDEEVSKRGIIERNENRRIVSFLEKPKPEETTSRSGVPCFYIYQPRTLTLLNQYLLQTTTLKERDAPGMLIAWLYSKKPVYGFDIKGRFDVGSLGDYIKAAMFFQSLDRKRGLSR